MHFISIKKHEMEILNFWNLSTQPHSHIAIQPHSYIATQPQSHIATELHSHKGGGLWPPPQRGGGLRPPPLYGFLCGYVAMWLCGYVALWLCSYVAIGLYGYVAMWLSPLGIPTPTPFMLSRSWHLSVFYTEMDAQRFRVSRYAFPNYVFVKDCFSLEFFPPPLPKLSLGSMDQCD